MSEPITKVESVVVHAVVKLLCKRMESNPEEFIGHSKRWVRFIERARQYGTDADVAELDRGIYHVRMGKLHQDMLAELLDPKGRDPEEEKTEIHRDLIAQMQAANYNAAMQNAVLQQSRGYGLSGLGPDSLLGGLSNKGGIL